MADLVAVLAGGPSNERQVSLWTAETITDSLTRQKIPHQVVDPRSPDWLDHLIALKPTVALLALHGTFGEDGAIQQILERQAIPFTGSGSAASRLAFDKVQTKQRVEELGFATPQWQIVQDASQLTIPPPVVIKPTQEGSSYGITIAWKSHDIDPAVTVARKYSSTVLAEKYISGTEVTCGVLDLFGQAEALPLVEIRPETEFFDFKAKYDARFCHEICPAEISDVLTAVVQQQSVEIFRSLGCRQYARLDWIIANSTPYFLEVNTLPGMTKTSLINKELTAAGIDFDRFIRALIDSATQKGHNKSKNLG